MSADRIIGGLDIDTYTSAPLRVAQAIYIDAPPRTVFAIVSDHANLFRWLPGIRQVNVNRGHATVRDGVGTIRYLHTGVNTIREYIIAYHPPHLMAYSIEQNALIIDHVSVVYLEPERYGGTHILWQHYFRMSVLPGLTTPATTLLLNIVFTLALRNLRDGLSRVE
jgi:uncharacterized protein YndB with AHSA1/START domain